MNKKTLHRLFEEHVEKFPGEFALRFKKEESKKTQAPGTSCCGKSAGCSSAEPLIAQGLPSVRYNDLNRQANRFAHLLRVRGTASNVVVGLLLEPSSNMIAAILGILKAGGAYLPIDPLIPQHQLVSILNQSQAPILLSTNPALQRYELLESGQFQQETGCDIITMDDSEELLEGQAETNPENINQLSDLVSIIYTTDTGGKLLCKKIPHSNAQLSNIFNTVHAPHG